MRWGDAGMAGRRGRARGGLRSFRGRAAFCPSLRRSRPSDRAAAQRGSSDARNHNLPCSGKESHAQQDTKSERHPPSEQAILAPKRRPFGVRELCSRFYGCGLIAQTKALLAGETSKAAAEPPHSKKETRLVSRALENENCAGRFC